MSRKMKGCLTLFWGRWYLPIPHADARISIAVGDAVAEAKLIAEPTEEDINNLHDKAIQGMKETLKNTK